MSGKFKITNSIIGIIKDYKWDEKTLLEEIGTDLDLSRGPIPSIDPEVFGKLIQWMAVKSKTTGFTIRSSSKMTADTFGVVGLSFIHSRCLEEAIDKIGRYKKIIGPEKIELHSSKGTSVLSFSMNCATFPYHHEIIHGSMAFVFSQANRCVQTPWVLESIEIEQVDVEDKEVFKEIFGRYPITGSSRNALIFSQRSLGLNFTKSDLSLGKMMDLFAEDIIKKIGLSTSIKDQVKNLIRNNFDGQKPKIEHIASELGIGKRNLQSKLSKKGLSFSDLLEESRKEFSHTLLNKGNLEIAEIAFLLGYSSSSSFGRAFKKWFDITPDQVRKKTCTI